MAAEHAVDVADDLAYVIVWEATGPSRTDAISTVGQNEWYDGHVPLRLHTHIVIIVVLEQVVIHSREKKPSQRAGGGVCVRE